MKTILCLAIFILTINVSSAQEADSLSVTDSLILEISNINQTNQELTNSINDLTRQVSSLKSKVSSLSKNLSDKSDSIKAQIDNTEKRIITDSLSRLAANDTLLSRLKKTNTRIDHQSGNIERTNKWGIIIAILVLALSAILSIFLNSRGNAKIEDLQYKAKKLHEEIIDKFSSEISEIQKISSAIGTSPMTGTSEQNEQDLIKALADRITFMEMTLYRMDSSIRGYKQLTKSISQMKNNLMANGYEIVDMLGKPYHDGMKVTANFQDDESIEQGKQIITGIIKPQINYQGKMIQAAQITVSQNI